MHSAIQQKGIIGAIPSTTYQQGQRTNISDKHILPFRNEPVISKCRGSKTSWERQDTSGPLAIASHFQWPRFSSRQDSQYVFQEPIIDKYFIFVVVTQFPGELKPHTILNRSSHPVCILERAFLIKLINRGNTPGPCKLSCAGVGVLSEMCSAGIIFKTACTNTFAGQGQLTLLYPLRESKFSVKRGQFRAAKIYAMALNPAPTTQCRGNPVLTASSLRHLCCIPEVRYGVNHAIKKSMLGAFASIHFYVIVSL